MLYRWICSARKQSTGIEQAKHVDGRRTVVEVVDVVDVVDVVASGRLVGNGHKMDETQSIEDTEEEIGQK